MLFAETQTVCSQCCKMIHVCCFTLLLCLSANAVWRENVTLKCSSAGCPSITEDYDSMYLYQDAEERTEVLYYHSNPGSIDKITPGVEFTDRIQTTGSLKSHIITISNLTVDDSGVYSCVYIKFPKSEVTCGVSTLYVRGAAPCPRSVEVVHALASEKSPPLIVPIIAASSISMLVTMIFILLIIPRVRRWTSSSRRIRLQQVSNDNVYEDMTKNGLRPARAQPSPSQNDCA